MQRIMRWGGTMGIIAVLLFVVTTMLGSYISPAYSLTLRDTDIVDRTYLGSDMPTNTWNSQLVHFTGFLVIPLLFSFVLYALHSWLLRDPHPLAGWLHWLTLWGIGLWLFSGIIRVLIIPAAPLADAIEMDALQIRLLWLTLANGLFDGAYLILATHATLAGWLLHQKQHTFAGSAGMINGITTILILLAGPYSSLTIFSVAAYGGLIFWYFALSSTLLINAEKISDI